MDRTAFLGFMYNFKRMIDNNTCLDLLAYGLLLKYGELLQLDYCQENYSIKYLSRLYGDIILEDDLCDYIEEIERYRFIPSGLLSEPFRKIIHRFEAPREKQLLLEFFRTLSELQLDNEDDIVFIFDEYTERNTISVGKTGVENTTNLYLAKLESALLDVKDDLSIYDPFCGTGKSIVNAGNNKNPLHIRDINSNNVAIAIINLIIHGCKIKEAYCGDSLFVSKEKYDRVISEPPFNAKYFDGTYERMKEYKEYLSRDGMEIETIIDSLNNQGKAVILIPLGFLFRGGKTQEYRKYLLKENLIECIVNIPSGVLYGTQVSSALLVINKNKKNNEILMIDTTSIWQKRNIRELYLSNEKISEIAEISNKFDSKEGISIVVSNKDLEENDYNLTPSIYVTPYSSEKIELQDINELIKKHNELEEQYAKVSKELNRLRLQ